ncbi:hypothetical protein A3L12_05410 [Thermococcus sp. P6]|uniref:hypothetical protein n=1 Tax=Thermococcus sp. P6 TaxID=122420 RepID=UPI000B59DCEA|nr:hypothetical protein [Thermococcus sp. P6]ASJ10773.1 hypothetical protein A3L12_05410 [Thermococcus sp. P6]
MKGQELLRRKLHVVREQRKFLMLEEARLIRLARQKKSAAMQLAKIKKEKVALTLEEARILRALKQSPTL